MDQGRCRARDVGIVIGPYEPGRHNAITDVPGVRVGHVTLIRGEGPLRIGHGPVRTGVTAIVPPGDDWFHYPVEAGAYVFNGAGTTAGLSLIDEYGRLETPILLTNTLSVGAAYEGIVRYMVDKIFRPRGEVPWFSPTVGETADGYLNDIGGLHVRPEHAMQAIAEAAGGPVPEGAVGAGTGTSAFGWKGGIGTASRRVEIGGERRCIGVLVQSNFGGTLTINGVPMTGLEREGREEREDPPQESLGSSIMIIVATDLPLSSRLLQRLARRAAFGLARTGSSGSHGSGDYVIAFSTTYRTTPSDDPIVTALRENEGVIDTAFKAVADATEEAILNSMFMAVTVTGRDGHTRRALPIERVVARLRACGVLS